MGTDEPVGERRPRSAAFLVWILLRTGMPQAIISKIGSGSRVIRMEPLGAIAGIDGHRSRRVGVGIINISGVVAIIRAVSQSEHRARDQTPNDTRPVAVIAVAAVAAVTVAA